MSATFSSASGADSAVEVDFEDSLGFEFPPPLDRDVSPPSEGRVSLGLVSNSPNSPCIGGVFGRGCLETEVHQMFDTEFAVAGDCPEGVDCTIVKAPRPGVSPPHKPSGPGHNRPGSMGRAMGGAMGMGKKDEETEDESEEAEDEDDSWPTIEEIVVIAQRLVDAGNQLIPNEYEYTWRGDLLDILKTKFNELLNRQTPPTLHAGVCPTGLSDLPAAIGFIRHDDVQSYKLTASGRAMQRTSGFYAVDMGIAVVFAIRFLQNGEKHYTPGVHQHTHASTCGLAEASDAKFNSTRSRSDSIVWRNYHLIFQNCQHWAKHVWDGA